MPRGDGTGPTGQGPGTGRGGGMGRGNGQGMGGGQGRMGDRVLGPGGNCLCPSCETKIPHQQGVPCVQLKCPKCATTMVRE
ncbi:hypothetical protein COZ13_01810 [Candidatus Desantisbacteria bacterium CG_4_10_14_3_um_filter_40_18]|uniref:Ferredoxin n=1 Tax=Candidatus Desantisbacteria bacterium CG_4_10_14_3_um_filter_40_18 TaxID=1974544 RepID=A0A2M7P334_9BACT|nr:MAG: hypothetical protein COZ13_01810 [Candidatus Desantisbacteria bacterium CG_4_10_14_3_um_filter_40_18]